MTTTPEARIPTSRALEIVLSRLRFDSETTRILHSHLGTLRQHSDKEAEIYE